jgi:hypothetical protein
VSEGTTTVVAGGRVIPRTVSENGSLYPPGMPPSIFFASEEDTDGSLVRDCCRWLLGPMLDCFFFNTFDRGLSMVEADEPDTRDGVRVFSGTSSLRGRDEVWRLVFEVVRCGVARVEGTVGVVLPWRRAVTWTCGGGPRSR